MLAGGACNKRSQRRAHVKYSSQVKLAPLISAFSRGSKGYKHFIFYHILVLTIEIMLLDLVDILRGSFLLAAAAVSVMSHGSIIHAEMW